MAERTNAAVLKTAEASRSPGVRIPLPPLPPPDADKFLDDPVLNDSRVGRALADPPARWSRPGDRAPSGTDRLNSQVQRPRLLPPCRGRCASRTKRPGPPSTRPRATPLNSCATRRAGSGHPPIGFRRSLRSISSARSAIPLLDVHRHCWPGPGERGRRPGTGGGRRHRRRPAGDPGRLVDTRGSRREPCR